MVSWLNRDCVLFLANRPINIKSLPTSKEMQVNLQERGLFWSTLFSKYQLNLNDVSQSILARWVLAEGFDGAFNELVKRTPAPDLMAFLLQKTENGVLGSTAHDRATLLQDLVSCDRQEVLTKIDAVCPDWIKNIDKKGRSLLFFVRDVEMLNFLLEKKIDLTIKNEKGQTVENYWVEARLPKQSLLLQALSEACSDYSTSMVSKLVSGNLKFTPEEKEAFEQAQQDPHWSWTGRLHGIDRTWTLPEMVKLTELMMAIGNVTSAVSQNKYYDRYYGILCSRPNEVVDALKEHRKKLGDLSKTVFDPARPTSMFEKALDFTLEAREKPDGFILQVPSTQRNYYNMDPMYKLQAANAKRFLSSLPVSSRDDFNKEMVLILRAPWARTKDLISKWAVYISEMALPLSEKGYATSSFSQAMMEDRQKEGLRHPEVLTILANKWATDLDSLIKAFEKSPASSDWKDAILMIMCACGSAGSGLTKEALEGSRHAKVQKTLADVLSRHDVGITTIPVRWTKNYQVELETIASKWALETVVEKRMSKKPTPPPPTPKRKM